MAASYGGMPSEMLVKQGYEIWWHSVDIEMVNKVKLGCIQNN